MAKIQVQVSGGQIQSLEAGTIGELKQKLGVQTYTAQVNGEPVDNSHELSNFEFVTFAEAVKAGC